MKLCTSCKEAKDLNAFSKNNKMKDKLSIYCKECLRLYRKREYLRKKEDIIQQQRTNFLKYLERNREFVLEYLKRNPCVDCGETDPVVLEFDHLSDKIVCVGQMVNGAWSLEKISQEITKCEVRCCNCHKRMTSKRAMDWRWRNTRP